MTWLPGCSGAPFRHPKDGMLFSFPLRMLWPLASSVTLRTHRLPAALLVDLPMLRELAHLIEIQKDIRAKAKVLAAVAENEAGSSIADRCVRLSLQCKQLDSAIEAFVSSALAGQASQGSA